MGMSKTTVSFFLPIFFATIVICAIVLCTCAYCYKPSYFLGIRGTAESDYDDDPEKAPRGRVVVVSTETAADHPSDHSDYDPEAEEIEILDALPEDEHHGEHIDIIDAHHPH
ncbi:hypothetical protein Q9L58_007843 [Maublancomyces gigas]|uniref:Uncharacterized protein n=1 Tax=Discina gigas TaxID=1032678 RepID=A0ABR3GBN8_9PEZI